MGLENLDTNHILAIFYIWSNVIATIIFTILFFKSKDNKQTSIRYFNSIIIGLIIYFLGDILWTLSYHQILPNSDIHIKIARIIYYSATNFMAYFWLMYVEVVLESILVTKEKRKWFLIALGLSIILNITLISFFDLSNPSLTKYLVTGALIVLPATFIIFSVAQIIHKVKNIQDMALKKKYFTLIIWPVVILISGVLQVFMPDLPVFCCGSIIVVLSSYIYNQDSLIFTDSLTEVNNRNMINHYLRDIKNYSDTYYLLMIDIDNFKSINDTYGHVEGDKALKHMARILKEISSNNNCFLARYGGDEFIIITKTDSEEAIKELINEIHERFSDTKEALGYSYSTSVGYTKMNNDEDIDKNIARADKYLYKRKDQLHHKN